MQQARRLGRKLFPIWIGPLVRYRNRFLERLIRVPDSWSSIFHFSIFLFESIFLFKKKIHPPRKLRLAKNYFSAFENSRNIQRRRNNYFPDNKLPRRKNSSIERPSTSSSSLLVERIIPSSRKIEAEGRDKRGGEKKGKLEESNRDQSVEKRRKILPRPR